MLPILQIGPLALQVPGLIMLLGLWLGLSFAERRAPGHGINPTHLYNLSVIALLAGVVGARLAYVGRFPAAFAASPVSLVSLNPGLLDLWGGIGAGVLAALVYGQRKKLPFWATLDALTPALAFLSVALGLSHLAAGTAYGRPTGLPWAIELWGAPRHPSQIYETLAAVLILYAVGYHSERMANGRAGRLFLTFLAASAGARLALEGLRGDSPVLPNGWRTIQLAAWMILAVSLWLRTRPILPLRQVEPAVSRSGRSRTSRP